MEHAAALKQAAAHIHGQLGQRQKESGIVVKHRGTKLGRPLLAV
jgi:hypothetical protein